MNARLNGTGRDCDARMINQGTMAGIKNAKSISSNCYFKLEWPKFFREIFAIGACVNLYAQKDNCCR